jgi:6-phosphogluconate dehydrogenase
MTHKGQDNLTVGMIGLGRMGANIIRRLGLAGFSSVGFDHSSDARAAVERDGYPTVATLAELVAALPRPRILWLMIPHGEPTDQTIGSLAMLLDDGDVVIDGGNSFFKDDPPREAALRERGIRYLDVGVSGGVWGLERGYCLMVGGDRETAERIEPIFAALAPEHDVAERMSTDRPMTNAERGYLFCGPAGAGHFVKMIHNGIEYGMMQALAEGFDILRGANGPALPSERRYDLDLGAIAELWRHGSVVSSWLLDLTAQALAEDGDLSRYSGVVGDSGEGRWTIAVAIEEEVPAAVLTAALFARFRSRQDHSFADKMLSAMRAKFGGHAERQAARPINDDA